MFFKEQYNIKNIRKHVHGMDKKVLLNNGKRVNYINFDNGASTPTLVPIVNKVNSFLEWYSSIHRGTGYKSQISTNTYEQAREIVLKFVNADSKKNTAIFVKNTTEAINKLSFRLNLSKDDVVITTLMEHHSNDLPWRDKAKVIYVNFTDDGSLDLDDLQNKLKKYIGKVKLVSITGASNVTGIVNDIHKIASITHKFGALIMVDGAQLIPHRRVNMMGYNNKDYIDFLVFSGHKMYAPFGSGVLIGPKNFFAKGDPEYVGGGTILSVSQYNSHYANPPEKDEAGTPNVVGTVALGEAINILNQVGMDNIKKHERKLTNHLIENIKDIPNITIYSPYNNKNIKDLVGVISFNIKGIPHGLLASVLSYEGGIGVRNGCFCAHPYIHRLLNLSQRDISNLQKDLLFNKLSHVPGLVRISFGMYNNLKEVKEFSTLLKEIVLDKDKILNSYYYNNDLGEYLPKNLNNKLFKDFTI